MTLEKPRRAIMPHNTLEWSCSLEPRAPGNFFFFFLSLYSVPR